MKLLDKKRILSDSNALKKNQIDEGVQIAKKVDLLRNELASLEKQRELFITGSRTELKKAIGVLEERKDALAREIAKEEDKLALLRKPLDDEWAKLSGDVIALGKGQEQLKIDQNELSEKAKRNEETEERFSKRESAIAEKERSTGRLNKLAEERFNESERIRDTARRESERQSIEFTRANAELAKSQKENELVAKNNERIQKDQDLREKRLDNKERAIKDKYETLLRTIKRVKK